MPAGSEENSCALVCANAAVGHREERGMDQGREVACRQAAGRVSCVRTFVARAAPVGEQEVLLRPEKVEVDWSQVSGQVDLPCQGTEKWGVKPLELSAQCTRGSADPV